MNFELFLKFRVLCSTGKNVAQKNEVIVLVKRRIIATKKIEINNIEIMKSKSCIQMGLFCYK
jgi:hypothetical protein